MDALIFGYYADQLQKKYEVELNRTPHLSDSVIAYRRIPIEGSDKNKSTIHFAKEVFTEITNRVHNSGDCSVLMFDIKSFFSRINHDLLLNAWTKLLGTTTLPPDHRNVFNATTRFSYILYDDLILIQQGKKRGFDEKKLAEIRKNGKHSFFNSAAEFREKIENRELKIYRFPFTENKKPVGIPQGLAISAVLANLYLLEFDKTIVDEITSKLNAFYRRYSDDILIICKPSDAENITKIVTECIEQNKVSISKDKTEEFLFRYMQVSKNDFCVTAIKIKKDICQIGHPLTYLGFEFYGNKVLIKSTNLSKFYRRMILSVKSKAKQAKAKCEKSPHNKYAIYRRQLYKLYTLHDLNATEVRSTINKLTKNEKGFYQLKIISIEKPYKSNYLTYVNRVCEIMNDKSPLRQVRNHTKILNEAIHKQLKKYDPANAI